MRATHTSYRKELTKDEKLELADEIFQLDKEIVESQVKLSSVSSQLKNEIKYKSDLKNEKQGDYLLGEKEIDLSAYPLKDYKNNKIVFLGFKDLEPVHEREMYPREMQSSFEDNLSYSNNEIDQMRDDLIQEYSEDFVENPFAQDIKEMLIPVKAFILDFIYPNESLKDTQIELEININTLLENGIYDTCVELIEYASKVDLQRKVLFDIPMAREVIEFVVHQRGGTIEEITYEDVDEENEEEYHLEHLD